MNLLFRKCFYCFALYTLLMLPFGLCAQSSVWNTPNKLKKSAGDKVSTTKHKLKDTKERLQNWGIDTNYNHAFLIGGKLNSDGWSGSTYLLKKKNNKTINFWQLNFSEIKHEKQTKEQGSNQGFAQLGSGTPFVFGKINNLYTLQIGFGMENLLLPAVMEGNLSVSYRCSGGFSLAMLKPYYLKLIYENTSGTNDSVQVAQQKYSKGDSTVFLNNNRILGASGFTKGLSEINYVPGAYLEMAITILPGQNKFFIQVINLGINTSLYASYLPIMADQKAYNWQIALFAALAIGERWK